jgi:hypothetical protein
MTHLPTSDLTIPPVASILALVKERYDQARHFDDTPGARQLDRVRVNLLAGARLAWSLGDLLVQSVNNPGQVYSVSARGCTCPNGVKGKASCWHVCLYDTLIDMRETEAETADQEADQADEDDDEPELRGVRRALDDAAAAIGYSTAGLGQRLAAARARLAA